MTESAFLHNPAARSGAPLPLPTTDRAPLAFHHRLPGYAPTPLIEAPELARHLGVGQVLIKVESSRLGLPAFKILGASWAVSCAIEERLGESLGRWRTLDELAPRLDRIRPITIVAATDGNHGRAVAHTAALLGFKSRIYVPQGTAQARIDGITSEGAHVEIVDGTYDDAVARSSCDAGQHCIVVSDTSWPGYEDVPRSVMEGYSTIFWEIDDELAARAAKHPDLVAVQFGVGALAAAVVTHYRQPERETQPTILSVEPLSAACMLASMKAGEIVTVPGPHDSIMAGLNCGRPSMIAWPIVSRGIDAFIAVSDERACEAMRALERIEIIAGETGGAGLAGVLELLCGGEYKRNRALLDISENTRVLLIVTEGATDPQAYAEIVR